MDQSVVLKSRNLPLPPSLLTSFVNGPQGSVSHEDVPPQLECDLQVTAYSPTNRPLGCPVSEENGTFFASFQPDQAGEWRIHVTYDDDDIENSPFRCMVFDPRAIKVRSLYCTG